MLVSLVVRCPLERRDVDTGILMDEATFKQLTADQVRCPACGKLHILERARISVVDMVGTNSSSNSARVAGRGAHHDTT